MQLVLDDQLRRRMQAVEIEDTPDGLPPREPGELVGRADEQGRPAAVDVLVDDRSGEPSWNSQPSSLQATTSRGSFLAIQ